MPTTTVIFRPKKAKISALELDASVSETHEGDVEVTDHPVEQGANITDHAREKPERLTIQGLVSNTPVGTDAPADRAGDALAALRKLKSDRQLVTVVTSLRTYENMMLTTLSIPRDATVGDSLRFSATFQQVRLAVLRRQTVRIRTQQGNKDPKANDKVDSGKQVAESKDPTLYRWKLQNTLNPYKLFGSP